MNQPLETIQAQKVILLNFFLARKILITHVVQQPIFYEPINTELRIRVFSNPFEVILVQKIKILAEMWYLD